VQENPFKSVGTKVNELIREYIPIDGLCTALLNIDTVTQCQLPLTVVWTKSHCLSGLYEVYLKLRLFVMYLREMALTFM